MEGASSQPPRGFTPSGTIRWARACATPLKYAEGITKPRRSSISRYENGLRYERKVQAALLTRMPALRCNQWFEYIGQESFIRHAQPDAFLWLEAERTLVIFEIKLRHVVQAWWQLRQRYEPILRHVFQPERVFVCEVCTIFDPQQIIPEPPRLTRSLERLKEDVYNVLIFK